MLISRLLRDGNLGLEEIERLELAYSRTLQALHLVDRDDDPLTEMIAKKIIEIAATGVSDPAELSEIAIKQLDFK